MCDVVSNWPNDEPPRVQIDRPVVVALLLCIGHSSNHWKRAGAEASWVEGSSSEDETPD